MGNKNKGIYNKFRVTRVDGRDIEGQKHFGCFYFVLDTVHDPHAIPALKAYAKSCENEYPLLAKDVREVIKKYDIGWVRTDLDRDAR